MPPLLPGVSDPLRFCPSLLLIFASLLTAPTAGAFPQHIRPAASDTTDANAFWSDRFGGHMGLNDEIKTLAVGAAGLFAGGDFSNVGGIYATPLPSAGIATWTGSAWELLGDSLHGSVTASAVVGTDLYFAGSLTWPNDPSFSFQVFRWNGEHMHQLGAIEGQWINLMAVLGSDVYIAGDFETVNGVAASNIARWNGTQWESLGEGIDGRIQALTASEEALYISEEVITSSGPFQSRIVRWNGTQWDTLSTGFTGAHYALAVRGSTLYADGMFGSEDDPNEWNISMWDGQQWTRLGSVTRDPSQSSRPIAHLAVYDGDLYIAGNFNQINEEPAYGIARWNDEQWTALPWPGPTQVTALTADDSGLYVGLGISRGSYREASIVKWDGDRWHIIDAPNNGTNGEVYALAKNAEKVYAGGTFTTAGGQWVSGIAAWTGDAWEALGEGVDGPVYAVAVNGTDVYVGGAFTTAGGQPANNIARWNGSQWESLGEGVPNTVHALLVDGDDVYTGLQYLAYAPGTYAHVARWNGSQWTSMEPVSLDGQIPSFTTVDALTFWKGELYAGGQNIKTNGEGTPVAKWNGTQWESSGGCENSISKVYALASDPEALYAGGWRVCSSSSQLQRWDGSAWERVPTTLYPEEVVTALALHDSRLYLGGNLSIITEEGTVSAGIGLLSEGHVEPLGDGIWFRHPDTYELGVYPGFVHTMIAGDDGTLYVGGRFRRAGDKVSNNFAIWDKPATPSASEPLPGLPDQTHLNPPYPNPARESARFSFALSEPGRAHLEVYNVLGQRVALVSDRHHAAGPAEITWAPDHLPAGLYVVRLTTNRAVQSQPFILIR